MTWNNSYCASLRNSKKFFTPELDLVSTFFCSFSLSSLWIIVYVENFCQIRLSTRKKWTLHSKGVSMVDSAAWVNIAAIHNHVLHLLIIKGPSHGLYLYTNQNSFGYWQESIKFSSQTLHPEKEAWERCE